MISHPLGAAGSLERAERSSMITLRSSTHPCAARSANSRLQSSVSNAYGGSMNTTSYGALAVPPASISAFRTSTWARISGAHERLCFNCATVLPINAAAGLDASTAVSSRAPRLNASMPKAPVPANRSSTRASSSTPHESKCEKIASLVRSVVGLVPCFGVVSATPLNRPEITRIRFSLQGGKNQLQRRFEHRHVPCRQIGRVSCWSGTPRSLV